MPYLRVLHTLEEGAIFFAAVVKQRTVQIADINGKAVGYFAYGDGRLDHLYFHPDHEGRGIGSGLLKRKMIASNSLQLWAFQKCGRDSILRALWRTAASPTHISFRPAIFSTLVAMSTV
jgi:GNAT superfamily N-acetyltransferase